MTQEQADYIYLQQVQQYQQDRSLQRLVTLLQGMAALLAIIIAFRMLIKKTA